MKESEIRPCIVCLARDEERFIREFLDVHFAIGFEKVFIIDNNDPDKRLELDDPRVEIIRLNDMDFSYDYYTKQVWAYNRVLAGLRFTKYTHCAIVDIDEHIELRSYKTIQEFIKKEIEDFGRMRADIVWETYDDNDIIYEKDTKHTLRETYTRQQTKLPQYDFNNNSASWSKPIFKTSMSMRMTNAHFMDPKDCESRHITPDIAVIRHYRTKCMETFFNHKLKNCNIKNVWFGRQFGYGYFLVNKETPEKLEAFKKFCKEYNVEIDDKDFDYRISELKKRQL